MSEPSAEIRLFIRSRFEEIDLVDGVATAVLSHAGIEENELEHLVLAIREAVANAVEHGHALEESEAVEVRIAVGEEGLNVEVRDRGEGFDPRGLPDPVAPENLLKPRGRGIFLMRSFMDEVTFRFPGRGTVVTLRKVLVRS